MIIDKLKALRGLFQEIADDPNFKDLNSKTQDVIEDMTYEIPIEITLLQGKIGDANCNVTVGTGDNVSSGV